MRFFGRQGLGRTLLLTAVLVVGAVCMSYGDNPAALVGQWVSINDGKSVELFKDGTGVVGNVNLTWKTEGKRFVLSSGNKSRIGDYNLSGYELTRTFDDREDIVWVKKDKVEEYKNKKKKEAEQKYRSVKIGGKTWMAQSLNYQTGKSWCYDGDPANCDKYGRLYTWEAAKAVCLFVGMRLPTLVEWDDLVNAVGESAGKKLKARSDWYNNGNGTDDFGFSALPGGGRRTDGSFINAGRGGYWWTATEGGNGYAFGRGMRYDEDRVDMSNYDKGIGRSVCCVSDN